jgi:peptide/nickel transport system permease protein
MGSYLRYVAKRLLAYVAVILVAVMINFLIPRLIPGDPIMIIVGRLSAKGATTGGVELVEQYKHRFGLDADLFTQFFSYLRETLRGNLGYSIIHFPCRVDALIVTAIPWTIGLLSITTITSWAIGTLMGTLSGWSEKSSKFSKIASSISLVLYATPYWILAMILVFAFAYTFAIFPMSGGFTHGVSPSINVGFILDVVRHSMLPMLSIILSSLGWWYLSMRSLIVGLKGKDFILMAEAKGLSKSRIMWKYAFRNALLPQVTGLALTLGNIMGGALLTEVIFAYPGLGWLLYNAVTNLDYPVVQGITLIIILAVCTATLILDLIYPLIDPRVSYVGE